ncbi:MAG: hypothetical protein EOM79_04090 [Epsilonproteobacteria bacterium]|jgi:hypothetical protein|nr:hypothetical protein [Bacilli bacterium]NCA95255.1 hypothetical protein [Campylobacterota bacterium]
MSKYDPLSKFIQNEKQKKILLSFEQIQDILGFRLDHSFLNCKKELLAYGYTVGKISLKEKIITFIKMSDSGE